MIPATRLEEVAGDLNVIRTEKVCTGQYVIRKAGTYSRLAKVQVPLLALLVYALLCVMYPKSWFGFDRNPDSVKLNDSRDVMLVYNHESDLLWQTRLDCAPLNTLYSGVHDIDGDGRNEVFHMPRHSEDIACAASTRLTVRDDNGEILFTQRCSITGEYPGDTIPYQYYESRPIYVFDTPNGSVIITGVVQDNPARWHINMWSATGDLVGWYVNSGHSICMIAADINDDGEEDLICLGYNNRAGGIGLFVIPAIGSYGVSPPYTSASVDLSRVTRGNQSHYMVFPTSDLALADSLPYDCKAELAVIPGGHFRIDVMVRSNDACWRSYYLDANFRVYQVTPSDIFWSRRRMFAEGGVLPTMNIDAYNRLQREQVQYWTDDGWTMDTTWFVATCTTSEWDDSIHVNVAFELKTTRVPVDELAAFTRAIVLVKARATIMSPYFRKAADVERQEILEEAITANPNDLSLLITLADLYFGNDNGGSRCEGQIRRDMAREVLARALALQPSNEMVAMRLASLYILDGRHLTADSILTSFASENPVSLFINLLQLEVAGELARYAESESLILKIMSQAPNDKMRVLLVEMYARQHKHAEAQNQIALLQTLRADSAQIMRARYQYYLISDSLDAVEEVLNNWHDTGKYVIGTLRADLYSKKGEYDKALQLSCELLAEDPDNTFLLNNVAWFYAMTETNLPEALELANRALGLRGECETSARNTRGVIFLKMGRLDEAKEDLTWCLQNQSAGSQTVNYYYLGECALVEDDRERAIIYFTMARDAAGDKKFVKAAQVRLDEKVE